jgi:hypothetical protein
MPKGFSSFAKALGFSFITFSLKVRHDNILRIACGKEDFNELYSKKKKKITNENSMVKFYIRVALVEFLSLMDSFLPSKICKQKFFFVWYFEVH